MRCFKWRSPARLSVALSIMGNYYNDPGSLHCLPQSPQSSVESPLLQGNIGQRNAGQSMLLSDCYDSRCPSNHLNTKVTLFLMLSFNKETPKSKEKGTTEVPGTISCAAPHRG